MRRIRQPSSRGSSCDGMIANPGFQLLDPLPEQRRRRAFPCFPLIDDGLPGGADQTRESSLADGEVSAQRCELHVIVLGNRGPGQWPRRGGRAALRAVVVPTKVPRVLQGRPRSQAAEVRYHRSPAAARPAPPFAASSRTPRSAARARVTEGVHDRRGGWRAPLLAPEPGAMSPAAPHPTSGTTRGRHRASPRTPLATSPARSGTHVACGAPRRPPGIVKLLANTLPWSPRCCPESSSRSQRLGG